MLCIVLQPQGVFVFKFYACFTTFQYKLTSLNHLTSCKSRNLLSEVAPPARHD